jgi:hypothetical protein
MIIENACPVCGYEMEAPPKEYRICPSCGTEFGVHDVNASIAELRESWMKTGPKWWSRTDTVPPDWDPITQMANAGIAVKRPVTSEASAVSTSTASRTIGGDWKGWAVTASGQPGDISHVMECD